MPGSSSRRTHGHDPDCAVGTRPGSLDLECHDGLRGIAVRLDEGTAAIRLRESRRAEKAPEWTLKVMGNGATDPKGGGEPGFGNRDRTGVNGIPDSLYRRMRTNAASS